MPDAFFGKWKFPSSKYLDFTNYEVFSINDESPGIRDEEVIARAITENLVILTFDRDYGELIFKYKIKNPPAVVYFRFKGNNPTDAGNVLRTLIEREIQLEGHFTVVERNAIRQRTYTAYGLWSFTMSFRFSIWVLAFLYACWMESRNVSAWCSAKISSPGR